MCRALVCYVSISKIDVATRLRWLAWQGCGYRIDKG